MKIHAVEPRPTLFWGVPVLSVISANENTKTSSSSFRLATGINELFSVVFFLILHSLTSIRQQVLHYTIILTIIYFSP